MKRFTSIFLIALLANVAVGQVNDSPQVADAEKLLASVQKICPVTGEALGSMGAPIKVMVGEETAFLCCDGCKGEAVNPEHWKTIQTNMAKAQGICPVMKKPLPENAKSIVVEGRRVFVCCPGCDKKIAADPASFVGAVNSQYASFLTAEARIRTDNIRIAVQKICPVSGEELGSMGPPIKVTTSEHEELFLCCKGCVGKPMKAQSWQTVQANIRAAQDKCPVMDKQLPAEAKSMIVKGRRVYICCPGCDKKLAADPDAYLAKVEEMNITKLDAQHHDGHADHRAGSHTRIK